MRKVKAIFGSVFGGIGIIMLIAAIIVSINTIKFVERAVETQAIITSIETYRDYDDDISHRVYVEYKFNEKDYGIYLSEYSSSMHEGSEITLLVDPNSPSEAKYSNMTWFLPIMFALFGIVFGGTGFGFLISLIKDLSIQRKAKEKGEQITATIIDIGIQENVLVNDEHPQYLICEYNGLYGKQIFKSEARMDFYNDLIGMDITVYFVDEKIYYVDLDSIKY